MYVALQIAAGMSVLSEPFLPFTSKKLKKMLCIEFCRKEKGLSWEDILSKDVLLRPEHQIGKSELLFSKIR